MPHTDPSPDSIALRWHNPDGTVEAVSIDYEEFVKRIALRLGPCLVRGPQPLGDEVAPSLRGTGADAFVRRLMLVTVAECYVESAGGK